MQQCRVSSGKVTPFAFYPSVIPTLTGAIKRQPGVMKLSGRRDLHPNEVRVRACPRLFHLSAVTPRRRRQVQGWALIPSNAHYSLASSSALSGDPLLVLTESEHRHHREERVLGWWSRSRLVPYSSAQQSMDLMVPSKEQPLYV